MILIQVYERGVALFTWPIVFEIWNVYLLKFIERYVCPIDSCCHSCYILLLNSAFSVSIFPFMNFAAGQVEA